MKTPEQYLIPSRAAKRAHYDAATINPILDEAIVCTMSFAMEGKPFSIPTAFVRYDDKIYVHGSVGSHFIREIEKGIPVCITVVLMDALVVAKSAFSFSVNYRSVIIFGEAEQINDAAEKVEALKWLTNKIVPGSWNYVRPIRDKEIRKTTVLAFKLDKASAKIRTGMPNDEEEDKALPIWSGIIPLQTTQLPPIADDLSKEIPLPAHLSGVLR